MLCTFFCSKKYLSISLQKPVLEHIRGKGLAMTMKTVGLLLWASQSLSWADHVFKVGDSPTTSYPPLPITNRFPTLSLQPMQIDTDTFVNWKRMVQVCVRQCWGHTKVVEPSPERICASKPQAFKHLRHSNQTHCTRALILFLRRPMCFVPCTLCRFSQHRTMRRHSLELFTVSATRLLAINCVP